ncbi:GNAT family N-acetyltransferase [Micromonospora sp. CPCC 206060]|uniref:GNAT family N-acetyltransferase n=1 Tax=Micromonospora sp. CPCC 206060 TaxID=3122406 RepID=UPI002FF2375A
MEIRQVTTVDGVLAAGALFDDPVRPDWATRFLDSPGHHLLVAYVDGTPVGMVTGVEMTHPDKGTELFLYELGVADGYQRRGIGGALVAALADLARERGLYGMWVVADGDNVPALATYRSAGGEASPNEVVFTWTFP